MTTISFTEEITHVNAKRAADALGWWVTYLNEFDHNEVEDVTITFTRLNPYHEHSYLYGSTHPVYGAPVWFQWTDGFGEYIYACGEGVHGSYHGFISSEALDEQEGV